MCHKTAKNLQWFCMGRWSYWGVENMTERRFVRKSKSLIAGVVCGLICACAVFIYTQGVRSEVDIARAEALSRYGGEQIEVCVALKDIAVGEKVDASNTVTKLWVADLLPANAVQALSSISGKQVTSNILAGEVISEERFADHATEWSVPHGLCALSVPAKDIQTIGGSLVAGMEVDVYATGTSTELLAENVLVVTTNIDGEEGAGSSISWVTLALDPEQVQEVIAASQKMELYFVLPGSQKKEES